MKKKPEAIILTTTLSLLRDAHACTPRYTFLRDAWAAAQVAYRKTHPEPAAEKAKKDAGDERLLCALLFEEGEPN